MLFTRLWCYRLYTLYSLSNSGVTTRDMVRKCPKSTSDKANKQQHKSTHNNSISVKLINASSHTRGKKLTAIPGGPQKNGTVDTVEFSGLCSDQQLSFITLLDRASFPHYNNTKIIKFGWELFILWVISYGLSFSGFARFPEFRGTINDKLMANSENDSP